MTQEEIQKKVARIQSLLEQKKAIEVEIAEMLSPEEKVRIITPVDFSVNNEVFKVIQESGDEGIAILTLVDRMKAKFPTYGIERKKVASAVAYLKNSLKKIESCGRSMYRIIKTQNTPI